jgi:hypothetical protein
LFTTYLAVTILAAAANAAAGFDFARHPQVLANMTMFGIPRSWLLPLGALKAAGALGHLAGIGVPLLGVAAAVGLVLFFVGAILTDLRAHAAARSYAYPAAFLLLAVGSLLPRLASW